MIGREPLLDEWDNIKRGSRFAKLRDPRIQLRVPSRLCRRQAVVFRLDVDPYFDRSWYAKLPGEFTLRLESNLITRPGNILSTAEGSVRRTFTSP